jgi:hypothetical protein
LKEILGSPNTDAVDFFNSSPEYQPPWTFDQYYAWLQKEKPMAKNKNLGLFYGMNPNNWPGVTPVFPDPCASIQGTSKVSDVSPACVQRIANNLPANNAISSANVSTVLTAPENTNVPLYNFSWLASVTPTVWHFDNIGNGISFNDSNAYAVSREGRLATWPEALVYIKSGNRLSPLLPGQNQWVAIRNNAGGADWMQVGDSISPGTLLSASDYGASSSWVNFSNDGSTWHNYVLWLGY